MAPEPLTYSNLDCVTLFAWYTLTILGSPSFLPWKFPWSFSYWIYCWLYSVSSFFVPGILKFHCGITWGGFIYSIMLSTRWMLMIWKFMSFRLRNVLELFLLISLASPFYLVLYYVFWSFYYLDVETPGVVVSSLLFAMSFFFCFTLLIFSTSFTSPFWVFNFCSYILYI